MQECEKRGLSIKDSIARALIMQRMEITFDEAESMINNFRSEKTAEQESKKFVKSEFDFEILDNENTRKDLSEFVINGYGAENVINSYALLETFDLKMKDVISNDVIVFEKNILFFIWRKQIICRMGTSFIIKTFNVLKK